MLNLDPDLRQITKHEWRSLCHARRRAVWLACAGTHASDPPDRIRAVLLADARAMFEWITSTVTARLIDRLLARELLRAALLARVVQLADASEQPDGPP